MNLKNLSKKRIVLNVLTFLFVFVTGTGLIILMDSGTVQSQNHSDYRIEANYEGLAALTKDLEPNPHSSHLGNIDCTQCHQAQSISDIVCATCHWNIDWYDELIE